MTNKIIVTNIAALRAKYGAAGVKKIRAAVAKLIEADKARGLRTTLVALDNAAAMKRVKGRRVTKPANARQNKAAVDAVFTATTPAYLLLLGATDVIPHQDLRNPLFGDDPDEFAYGDIPYACEAPYSQDPRQFIGPTRVVGRLPDLVAARKPDYLLALLATATAWKRRPAADYSRFFAVSAEVWKKSTQQSLQKLFGTSHGLQLSPPAGPHWSAQMLRARTHFINCHGGQVDWQFYGEKGESYPEAMQSSQLAGRMSEGTVAAVECCYGAELFDPALAGGQLGIGSAYLRENAYGYFGSSTIAYGPSEGNGAADLICQYFLRRVRTGASIGRAALEARLEFAGGAPELDPYDLKTVAQFSLLGDPSITPVAGAVPHAAGVGPKTRGGAWSVAKSLRAVAGNADIARAERRRQLVAVGLRVGATQAVATRLAETRTGGGLPNELRKIAASLHMTSPKFLCFEISRPQNVAAGLRALGAKIRGAAAPDEPTAFHVLTRRKTVENVRAPQILGVVAKVADGRVMSYRELRSR